MTIPRPQIIRRRVAIDFASAGPGRWYLRHKDVETILNILSFVFPPGEKYLIDSVQHYVDRITDPVLKEEARRFVYQEAMHSKEHDRCNDVLRKAHPNGGRIEKVTEFSLQMARWLTPKATQLAHTCAFEHFTAMLADAILNNQEEFIRSSRPEYATLWMWHSVEETEHKGVCLDVYQHVFGNGLLSHLHRGLMMIIATVPFVIGIGITSIMIRRTGLWSALKRSGYFKYYFDYYRRSFHPWDHDNAHLIAEWNERFLKIGIRSVDKEATTS